MPKKPTARKDHNKVPRAPRELSAMEPREAERVAKVIARAGLGSRREVEEWILAGRVAVNGEVLDTPARTVTPEDRIEVDGAPLPAKERTRLFLYHKPKGVVTTNYDPEGRPTLFEILPGGLPRLVSVGRLDLNTEGLILLTNDGGLSRVLELPETGWLRRYRVRAKGEITQDKLDALIKGVTVDGVHYGPIEAVLDRVQGANVWLTLALREGKNREVRNVLGSLGLDVNRLIRLSYGPFQLGEIAQGQVEEVRTRVLSDQLGPELSAAAGADFEGPLFVHDEAAEEETARPAKGKAAGKGSGPTKTARYAKAEGAEDRHRRRPIDLEESPERSVTSGLVADRKGRKVLVQRVRSTETASAEERPVRPPREREIQEAEREAKRARPVREPKAPGRAPGGERTFRKRPDDERGEGRRERQEDDRPRGERPFRSRDDSRPEGRRPFRSDDSRPPRRERPEGERTERPFRERTPRPEGERSERPFRSRSEGERSFRPREDGDRPARRERTEGDRPFRERAPRPEGGRFSRDGDSRPPRRERPEGERTERPFRERAPRAEGERPERPFRSRSEGGERRFEGERPARRERPEGERPPRRERPEGDRPFRERAPRPEGGRSFRGEGTDRPYSGRVKSEGSFRERPAGGRGFGKPGGRPPRDAEDGEPRAERRPARSPGDRPVADKAGGRFSGGKPGASRPEGERSGKPGGRPFGGKPGGGRPSGGKPGGKPFGGKPGGRPSGGKPGRPPRG